MPCGAVMIQFKKNCIATYIVGICNERDQNGQQDCGMAAKKILQKSVLLSLHADESLTRSKLIRESKKSFWGTLSKE